jgi:N-acetylmuramic acid 6-phosphate etherase
VASSEQPALFLGIEGGGTRTIALLADATSRLLQRAEFGPANLRLLTDAQLSGRLREIAQAFPRPAALGIGLAGGRGETEWARIQMAAAKVWRGVPCHATNDLETALAAAGSTASAGVQVLVLSGTGSCCYGRGARGGLARMGGWGHLLGDKGSGYEIGLRALKAVVFYLDRDHIWSRLGRQLLRTLQLNEPGDLVAWIQQAPKEQVAALALEVFDAATRGDRIARDILDGAASHLAKDAASCARKLVKTGAPARFILAGSVLLKQPAFARRVARNIKALWPGALVESLKREGAWGAVALAQGLPRGDAPQPSSLRQPAVAFLADTPQPLSPTEQRNPRSTHFDRLNTRAAIGLMLSEEARVPRALLAERAKLERAVKAVVRAFRRGGRLFYVGAGTSGRLGILDASECPPTFRTDPERVQGIIAGGQRAIWQAVEGAEDDAAAGARSLQFRGVGQKDVVVGIAASGRTPFVWGALKEARRRGAFTVLLCFNPHLKLPRADRPGLLLAPRIGPEVLTGSTRLKAGTATKLVLNLLTTLAMVRLGKVTGNLMVDLNPSNVKLRERAVRIVRELTGASDETARAALEQGGWVVKTALRRVARRP